MADGKREIKNYNEGELISKDMLKNVNGGYIFSNGDDPDYPYEMIDDLTGDVVCRFARKQDAIDSAILNGSSAQELTWDQLNLLRNH